MSETDRGATREAVRAFLRSEVVRDASLALGDDDALLSAGLITSFDLVSIAVFLERRFGVVVPDASLSREGLDSIRRIADLVESLRGREPSHSSTSEVFTAPAPSGTPDPIARAMPSFRRAPVAVALAILGALTLVELAARVAFERPGTLEALAGTDARRMSFDTTNYEESLARHDLARRPKGKTEVRIAFLGDSGTYGWFLTADEACPGVMGRLLAASDPDVHTYNLSYYGQSLVKDAEILEATLPFAPDLVVLSVGSPHLDLGMQGDCLVSRQTTVVENRALFERFLRQANALDRPELAALDATLAEHERSQGMGAEAGLRWLERRSVLASNRLLLRRALRALAERWIALALPPRTSGPRGASGAPDPEPEAPRRYRGKTTADVKADEPFSLDARQVVLLEAIIDRARAAGSEVALFVEPEPTVRGQPPRRVPWNDAGWRAIADAYEGVARRKHVPLVDARDLVPQDEFLDTDHHWSAEGNRAIGELLARELAPLVAQIRRERR